VAVTDAAQLGDCVDCAQVELLNPGETFDVMCRSLVLLDDVLAAHRPHGRTSGGLAEPARRSRVAS
jgi:hypothetical protein